MILLAFLLSLIPTLAFAQVDNRVHYLCPIDGDGSEANSFESRAQRERLANRGNVDIRTDGTKAAGYMVCASNVLPTNLTGVVVIGTSREGAVSSKSRTDIQTATGKALAASTVSNAVRELVIPKLPRPKSGVYEIRLGKSQPPIKTSATFSNDVYYKGLTVALKEWTADALQPAVAYAATLAQETWNCANNVNISCVHTWAAKFGTAWDIVSNVAAADGDVEASEYLNVALDTVDVDASVIIASLTPGAGTQASCSIYVRSTADATRTYYRHTVFLNAGDNSFTLVKSIAAANTTLDSDATDWTANDKVGIRTVGTTIEGYLNDVLLTAGTDGDIATGNYVGIRYFSNDTGGLCTAENFNVRDYVAPSATPRGAPLWLD